jgi:hypothetical protein
LTASCAGCLKRLAETVVDPHRVGQTHEPHPKRWQRRVRGHDVAHRFQQRLNFPLVDGEDEVLSGREMAIQRACTDTRELGDRI